MLRELQLDGTVYDKAATAIERIRTMFPIAERIYEELRSKMLKRIAREARKRGRKKC